MISKKKKKKNIFFSDFKQKMVNKILLIQNPGISTVNPVSIKPLYKQLKMIKNLCFLISKKFSKEQNR